MARPPAGCHRGGLHSRLVAECEILSPMRAIVRALSERAKLIVIGGLLVAGRLAAQAPVRALDDFLTHDIKLDASQLAAIARGETVSTVLPTADEHDVAVFAAVRVAVPRSFFVKRQLDFPAALRTPTRGPLHLFGDPAADADVQALQLTSDDLKDLRDCRPGACNFKLPATDMTRLRTTFDWTAPDVGPRVTAYLRQRMVDYVNAYRRGGDMAMVEYDDTKPVRASDALAAMLRDSSYAFRLAPSLVRQLRDYPHDTLPGATHAVFWSVDQLPPVRPVLRITHETVYSPPELPGTTIFADKQIYADHYFEAGLELLTAVDVPAAGAGKESAAITLLALRRYRFDSIWHVGLVNVMGRAVQGLKDNAVADLQRLKKDSEAAWRASGPSGNQGR